MEVNPQQNQVFKKNFRWFHFLNTVGSWKQSRDTVHELSSVIFYAIFYTSNISCTQFNSTSECNLHVCDDIAWSAPPQY